ncbi:DMT family transporter [Cellulomonas triticagri]|uniref:QacE family quaternary ammonium compound efflux SMR transporter n=1 Tax=Cellulomonas triticagri TaxID=2483352 RepID=A0A3M2JD22_9CELL|nr:SMR family transporter [Cellulomonas triticagri]RMI09483.1 QacE family quaternary ammonium compound efflux SMR transporter [Cellulomonas triticagri]
MVWLLLAAAIACEVAATRSLRVASTGGPRRWYAAVVAGYVAAFSFLSLTLAQGLGIGVAYGIWTATGVAVTAVASRVLFGEPLTRLMLLGIGLIVAGVLLVELGSAH